MDSQLFLLSFIFFLFIIIIIFFLIFSQRFKAKPYRLSVTSGVVGGSHPTVGYTDRSNPRCVKDKMDLTVDGTKICGSFVLTSNQARQVNSCKSIDGTALAAKALVLLLLPLQTLKYPICTICSSSRLGAPSANPAFGFFLGWRMEWPWCSLTARLNFSLRVHSVDAIFTVKHAKVFFFAVEISCFQLRVLVTLLLCSTRTRTLIQDQISSHSTVWIFFVLFSFSYNNGLKGKSKLAMVTKLITDSFGGLTNGQDVITHRWFAWRCFFFFFFFFFFFYFFFCSKGRGVTIVTLRQCHKLTKTASTPFARVDSKEIKLEPDWPRWFLVSDLRLVRFRAELIQKDTIGNTIYIFYVFLFFCLKKSGHFTWSELQLLLEALSLSRFMETISLSIKKKKEFWYS